LDRLFLHFSYEEGRFQAGPGRRRKVGASIKLFVKIGNTASGTLLPVPYSPLTDRYELELWSYPGNDLPSHLDAKGAAAFDRGEILVRPDLVRGRSQNSDGREKMALLW